MRRQFLFILMFSGISNIATYAAVPPSIAIQGRLTDSTGLPLSPGPKDFVFRIFDDSTAGNEVWPGGDGESQLINSDANGLWLALVGAAEPLTNTVFSDTSRWLAIRVDGTQLPRVRLNATGYAARVATIDGAGGGTITSPLGIMTPLPTSVLSIEGSFATRVRYTATDTELDPSDNFVVATANFVTLTLPPASSCPGRHYLIKNLVPGTSQVTLGVTPGSGDLIDGSPNLILTVQYMSYSVVSDGVSRWLVID